MKYKVKYKAICCNDTVFIYDMHIRGSNEVCASKIYTQMSSWKQPPSAKINNKTFRGTYFRYASLDIHCNAFEKFLENTIEVQISTQPYLKRMPLSGDNFSTYVIAYFRCVFYFLLNILYLCFKDDGLRLYS